MSSSRRLTTFVLAAALLGGCATGPPSSQPPTPLPVVRVASRGEIVIQACVVNTAPVDPALRRQALELLAQSVAALIQPDWSGAQVYLTVASQDPTQPGATQALSMPAISAYPPMPALTPTPATNPNAPYAEAPAQATVGTWDAQAIDDYNAQVRDVQAQLGAAQTLVRAWSTQVMTVAGSSGAGPADLTDCVGLGSLRFNNNPGQHYLFLAGPVAPPGNTSSWLSLAGTQVWWVNAQCPSLETCAQRESEWAQVLSAAGVEVHQHLWFDPGETSQLRAVFGAPVQK